MSLHQHDEDADELWNYFQSVIDWVKKLFSDAQSEMKGLDWGRLHEKYHEQSYDSSKVSNAVQRLYGDFYIKKKSGIFEYVLGGEIETKLLEIRVFDDAVKQAVYKQQTANTKSTGISNCPLCAIGHDANKSKIWDFKEMDADHVAAWSKGGATDIKNCQMLCKTHNQAKGNK